MDIRKIKKLIELLEESSLTELEIVEIYQSYDESVNQKYKVELNQRTIDRVKNSFQ